MKLFYSSIIFLILMIIFFNFNLCCADNRIEQKVFSHYYNNLGDSYYSLRTWATNLRLAEKAYQRAIEKGFPSQHIVWKIARLYKAKSDSKISTEEKNKILQNGLSLLKKDLHHKEPFVHLWYALLLGSYMINKGIMKTLYLRDQVLKELKYTESLNQNINLTYLGLAYWYFYIPKIWGGKINKAYQYIQQALLIDPNYTTSYLIKVKFLLAEKKYIEAKKILQKIINIKYPSELASAAENIYKAKLLLKKIN